MADFSRARVGDKCWSIQLGECEIRSITQNYEYAIVVGCAGDCREYTLNGRFCKNDAAPSLFHSKPEFTDPPPAKRMKKVKGWAPVKKNINSSTQYYIGTFLCSSEYEAKLRHPEYIAIVPIEFEVEDDD